MKVVLAYPKIRKRLTWSDEEIDHFIELLRFRAEIVDIQGVDAVIPRDEDDAPGLAAFIASGADYLISGDQDLLELRKDYSIESAVEFCRRL